MNRRSIFIAAGILAVVVFGMYAIFNMNDRGNEPNIARLGQQNTDQENIGILRSTTINDTGYNDLAKNEPGANNGQNANQGMGTNNHSTMVPEGSNIGNMAITQNGVEQGKENTTKGQTNTSKQNTTTKQETTTPPTGQKTTPKQETTTPPKGQTTTPKQETTTPKQDTTTPKQETTTPPTGQTTTPKQETIPAKQTTPNNTNNQSDFANEVVRLVNIERQAAGLSALKIGTNLASAANKRAQEIVQQFSHTRPNGSKFSTVLQVYNVSYNTAGENIAYGQRSPQDVMNAWMNSPGHKANIMNGSYGTIGVGVYETNGVIYWVQLFTN